MNLSMWKQKISGDWDYNIVHDYVWGRKTPDWIQHEQARNMWAFSTTQSALQFFFKSLILHMDFDHEPCMG